MGLQTVFSWLIFKVNHISLASLFMELGKQSRPRSDEGLHCLFTGISIEIKLKMKK